MGGAVGGPPPRGALSEHGGGEQRQDPQRSIKAAAPLTVPRNPPSVGPEPQKTRLQAQNPPRSHPKRFVTPQEFEGRRGGDRSGIPGAGKFGRFGRSGFVDNPRNCLNKKTLPSRKNTLTLFFEV